MNWIVTLTRNNLALTKEAIKSFRAQDIRDVHVLVVDNDSNDGTVSWLHTQRDLFTIMNTPQKGVAGGWNQALRWLFQSRWADGNTPLPPLADHVLVCNNDVVLRPDTYRHLVLDGGGFVTAVGTNDPQKLEKVINPKDPVFAVSKKNGERVAYTYAIPDPAMKRPHPDFSCFLIRRSTWEAVGEFNEAFIGAYCEDADYHLRMHRAGIRAECLDLPFLHHAAMTVKTADHPEQRRIRLQADKNRLLFRQLYGFDVGSPEYYRAFNSVPPPAPSGPGEAESEANDDTHAQVRDGHHADVQLRHTT